MKLIEVGWKSSLLKAGWFVSSFGTSHTFLFPKWTLRRVPRSLRAETIRNRFDKLVSATDLLEWWAPICGGDDPDDKLFLLRFPKGAWDIPWELLIERLYYPKWRAAVCLARAPDEQVAVAPCVFEEPLRILMLLGDDGAGIGQKLDLEAEVGHIESAWETLEMGIRECIEKPLVEEVTQANLASLLTNYRPHVLWFSGHGRSKPSTGLLLADRKYVSASAFADLIQQSGHPPLYAVFWACDTGMPDVRPDTLLDCPGLFEELTRVGVLALLVMQSPIRDASARVMATDLFRYLAAGFSLERAMARTRSSMLDDPPEGAHSLDWASPVVWSIGQVVQDLKWNSPAQPLAQLQLSGRQVMRSRLTRPSQLDSSPSAGELFQAGVWESLTRTWVVGNIEDGEHRYRWVRTLQAMQLKTGQFVIAIDMNDAETALALPEWASGVFHRMLPRDLPSSIAKILSEMTRVPTLAWQKLCEMPAVYLAIANPPSYQKPDWFWGPLLDNEDRHGVAVLSDQQIHKDIPKNWALEEIGDEMDAQATSAVMMAPRLARALAVLNMPVGSSYIAVHAEPGEGPGLFTDWSERGVVLVKTPAGPVISATVRRYILDQMDPDLLKRAHRDCVDILGHPQLSMNTQIREQRLRHLLGADLPYDALQEAAILCCQYREQNLPFLILQIVDRLGSLKVDLPSPARLCVAWSYLQLGRLAHATYWLQRCERTSPLETAWKHGMQAELYKSAGTEHSKDNALAEIEAAIRVCRDAMKGPNLQSHLIQRRLRAYRQDRARILQYLFYEKEQAAAEYEELVEEWSDQPEAAIDLAVVKRNLAECLRTLATDQADPRWERARELIGEAEQLVAEHPQIPVVSEILYEQAKAAEAEERLSEARQYLIQCQEAALQSQHFMMLAIAQSRHFWKCESFELHRWEEIEVELEGFPDHGWAVRVLVDGRLRAARHLEALGDLAGALQKLEAGRADLARNPSFDKGRSDRVRIARTMAGLQVIKQSMGQHVSFWSNFISGYPWAGKWLEHQPATTAEDIWAEVQ